jgi:polysaccharide transporter, PST family
MKKYHKIINDFLAIGLNNGAAVFFPVIVATYLTSQIGIENFGEYSYAMSIVAYVYILVDYGFDYSAIRDVARRSTSEKYIKYKFNIILQCKLILGLVAISVVLCISLLDIIKVDRVLVISLSLYSLFQSFLPGWYFQVAGKYFWLAAVSNVSKLVTLLLMFWLVKGDESSSTVGILFMIPMIITSLLVNIFTALKLNLKIYPVGYCRLKKELVNNKYIFLSQVNSAIYSNGNVLVMANTIGVKSVGYYVIADKMIRSVAMLVSPINTWLYPKIAARIETNLREILTKLKYLILVVGCVQLVILSAIYSNVDWIALNLFKIEAAEIKSLYLVLAPLPIILFANNILGIQIILNLNMNSAYFRILFFMSIFSLISSYVVSQYFRAIGVAIISIAIETIIVILFALKIAQYLKNANT